jgi:dual oxidase
VIGTYQHIAVNDWLPEWLGEPLKNYEGYDPSVDPQIEQFFQTAAMRFGHTLVTPGGYIRDYTCAKCKVISFAGLGNHRGMKGPVRTCNIFWRPQVLIHQVI